MLIAALIAAFHISSVGLSEADCEWIFSPTPAALSADDRKVADAVYQGLLERFGDYDLKTYALFPRDIQLPPEFKLSNREVLSACASSLGKIYNNEYAWNFLAASSSFFTTAYDSYSFDWTSEKKSDDLFPRMFPCNASSTSSPCFYPSRNNVAKWSHPAAAFHSQFFDPYYSYDFLLDEDRSYYPIYSYLPYYFRTYAPYAQDKLTEIAQRFKDRKELSYRLDRETLGALALSVAAIDGKVGNVGSAEYVSGRAWEEALTASLTIDKIGTDAGYCFYARPYLDEAGNLVADAIAWLNSGDHEFKTENIVTESVFSSEAEGTDLNVVSASPYRHTMRTSSYLVANLSASAPWKMPFRDFYDLLCRSYGNNNFGYNGISRVEVDFEWYSNSYVGEVNFIRPNGAIEQGQKIVIPASSFLSGIDLVDSLLVTIGGSRSAKFEKSSGPDSFIDDGWENNERCRKYRYGGTIASLKEDQALNITTNYLSKMSAAKKFEDDISAKIEATIFDLDVQSRAEGVYLGLGGREDISNWTITEAQLVSALSSLTNFTCRIAPKKIVMTWNPSEVYNSSYYITLNDVKYRVYHSMAPTDDVTLEGVAVYAAEENLEVPISWRSVPKLVEVYASTFFMPIRFFDYQYLKLRKD